MARMTPGARRVLVEERQAQILAAAVKVFAKKGFERATIKDIAKEARVSEGSIYNYFKSKNELLISIPRQVARRAVEPLRAELFQPRAGEPLSPAVTLTRIAQTFLSTFRQNDQVLRILLSALPTMNQAQREKYAEQVVMFALGPLESYCAEQIQQGIFCSELNPAIAARTFIGMFFPFVLLQDVLQLGGPTFNYEQVIDQAVQLFLQGVLAESPKGKRT